MWMSVSRVPITVTSMPIAVTQMDPLLVHVNQVTKAPASPVLVCRDTAIISLYS